MNKLAAVMMMLVLQCYGGAVSANVIIPGLYIGGVQYDVTFHEGSATFEQIWGDASTSNWTGLLGRQPLFYGDPGLAYTAAEAIVNYLGTTGATILAGTSDQFDIPVFESAGLLEVVGDQISALDSDFIDSTFRHPLNPSGSIPWTSFEYSESSGMPVPFTPGLMLAGLGAALLSRRVIKQS